MTTYIHGTHRKEQDRLQLLNTLINPSFLAWLTLRQSDRVLEVGSGLGLLTRAIAERVPNGQAIGVEFSTDQLERCPQGLRNLTFVQGDAHHLPFPDNHFDVVYCRYVLEHVTHPVQVLKEMRRVLKPNGRAYVMENDMSVARWDPECPETDRLFLKFITLQAKLGGDGLIGSKLFRLCREASFNEIELSMQAEIHHSGQDNFRLWLENVVGIIKGAADNLVEHDLANRSDIALACEEINTMIDRQDATAIFYWNRVSAVK